MLGAKQMADTWLLCMKSVQIGTDQRVKINVLIITLSLRAVFGQVRHIKQVRLLKLLNGVKVLVSTIAQIAATITRFATSILPPLQKAPRNVRLFFVNTLLSAESESLLSVPRTLMSASRNSGLLGFTKNFPLQTNSFKSKSFHPNRFCAHVHRAQFRLANLP